MLPQAKVLTFAALKIEFSVTKIWFGNSPKSTHHINELAMFLQKERIKSAEIIPNIRYQNLKKGNTYEETARELNLKVLKISQKINDQYPELSKYLEKMPVTFPVGKNPEVILKGLSSYYDSLNVLLNFHIKQHSKT